MSVEARKLIEASDRREYIRLDSVFPVEFNIIRLQGDLPGMEWQQGYTCNISEGGLCLETVQVNESTLKFLLSQNIYLGIRMRIPITKPAIKAVAEVAWYSKEPNSHPEKFFIGLKFRTISRLELDRILKHARWYKFSTKIVSTVAIVLFLALMAAGFYGYQLKQVNDRLISSFVDVQQEEISVTQTLDGITQKKQTISDQMKNVLEENLMRHDLELQYKDLVLKEKAVADKLNLIQIQRKDMQKKVVQKMVDWLKNHQSPTTGLVASFEGTDPVVKDWAFIYDEALIVNVFLLHGEKERAKKLLDFFVRTQSQPFEGFANAYFYDSGKISEPIVHCGPNIWMGIAIAQYTFQTKDESYLPVARNIADWLITIQDADPGGGLKGGPKFTWFATEHNLDAYAFFGMLIKLTGDEKYKTAQDKILGWLKNYAMIPHDADHKSPPINRGKGDSTIATDTFAWSLAALGPQKLKELDMDPEKVMEFAENNCKVTVDFKRPSGVTVKVSGFDFTREANLPRGGLVSPEWTSQVIVSYAMLSKYLRDQNNENAAFYTHKAFFYLDELNKLIITSPSPKGQGEGCLPYATLANVDTGHGWNTPEGSSTCSVAGTAYTIMAMRFFNPLMLEQIWDDANP